MIRRDTQTKKIVVTQAKSNGIGQFGQFLVIRGILRGIMAIAGSFTSTRVGIGIHYFITGIYPAFLLLYALFFFKEF